MKNSKHDTDTSGRSPVHLKASTTGQRHSPQARRDGFIDRWVRPGRTTSDQDDHRPEKPLVAARHAQREQDESGPGDAGIFG